MKSNCSACPPYLSTDFHKKLLNAEGKEVQVGVEGSKLMSVEVSIEIPSSEC